jgi:hypothetical protein
VSEEKNKSEEIEKNLQGCLGHLFVASIVIILSVLLRSYTVYCLWGWFIVPFGVIQIGMAWAFGISGLVGTIANSRKINFDLKKKYVLAELGADLASIVASNGLSLLFGYIAHQLM